MKIKKLKVRLPVEDLLNYLDPCEFIECPVDTLIYSFGKALKITGTKKQNLVVEVLGMPPYEKT